MSNNTDLQSELRALRASAENIDGIIKNYESRIKILENHNKEAENRLAEAEEKILLIEKDAKMEEYKYKKTLALKEGGYENLIRELFEAPANDLKNSIMHQSRSSLKFTLVITTMSILITVVVASWFQVENNKLSNDLFDKVDQTMSALESVETRTEALVENIWRDDENMSQLVSVIISNKSEFSDFATKNKVSIFYKLRLSDPPRMMYSDLVQAFEFAGLSKSVVPSRTDLLEWDREYVMLCDNAIAMLEGESGNAEKNYRMFNTYKHDTDNTDYEGWMWSEDDITYEQIVNTFKLEKNVRQLRIAMNT